MTDASLDLKGAHAPWKEGDTQIRIRLWNSMEPQISSSLVYLDTTKQVWDRAKELIFSVGNLRRSYNLYLAFFSFSLDDMSLEAFYG